MKVKAQQGVSYFERILRNNIKKFLVDKMLPSF
jgi:hypothetical protein